MSEAHDRAICEIVRLKTEFFACVDDKRWHDFGALFTPDAVIDYSASNRAWAGGRGAVHASVEAFVEQVSEMLCDAQTFHQATMPQIELDGDDRASGIWRMEDIVLRQPGSTRPQGHGYGYYHEKYRLTGGRWRISSLKFIRFAVFEPRLR